MPTIDELKFKPTKEQTKRLLNIYAYAIALVKRENYWDTEVYHVEHKIKGKFYEHIDKSDLFREIVWVILCSGFKAETVKKKWSEFITLLSNFDVDVVKDMQLDSIINKSPIKNKAKLRAIIEVSKSLTPEYLIRLREIPSVDEARDHLLKLPYIGKVTVWHLMRNIGFDCYKPDRHIVKLSELLSVPPSEMFSILKNEGMAELIGVADVILWRACAILGSAELLVKKGEARVERVIYLR